MAAAEAVETVTTPLNVVQTSSVSPNASQIVKVRPVGMTDAAAHAENAGGREKSVLPRANVVSQNVVKSSAEMMDAVEAAETVRKVKPVPKKARVKYPPAFQPVQKTPAEMTDAVALASAETGSSVKTQSVKRCQNATAPAR